MRKLTHQEFVDRLKSAKPHLTVLGEYTTSSAPIKIKCEIDGHIWDVQANSILTLGNCPECAKEKKRKHYKNKFLKDLSEIKPTITLLGDYFDLETKTRFKCNLDGYEWNTTPDVMLRGGCPKCANNASLTKQEFLDRVALLHPNIQVLGEYKKTHGRVELCCKLDGHVWSPNVSGLIRGVGCPVCYGNLPKTTEKFIVELADINPNIRVLGEYTGNNKSGILCECLIDGYVWSPSPNGLLRGSGCPVCKDSGYKLNKDGYFYVYRFGPYYGFGITNDFTDRNRDHQANFRKNGYDNVETVKVYKFNGEFARDLERYVKRSIPTTNSGIDGFRTECTEEHNAILLFRCVDELKLSWRNGGRNFLPEST